MRWCQVVAVGCLAAIMASGTASAASSSADQRIAQAGLVTLQDLPNGWASEPRSTTLVGAVTAKLLPTIPACKPLRPLLGINKATTRADSSDFIQGSTTFTNSVSVYADAKRADVPVAAYKGALFGPCFGQVVQKAVQEIAAKSGRITEVKASVQKADPGTSVGDNQAAATATVTFRVRGQRARLYYAVVAVRVGRAVDTFGYQDNSSPISDTMSDVIATSVGRLGIALGTSRTSAH